MAEERVSACLSSYFQQGNSDGLSKDTKRGFCILNSRQIAIPGIVFSGIGMAKAKKPEDKKGFAIAGLVTGIIALLISFGQCADTDDTLKELDKSIKELQSM